MALDSYDAALVEKAMKPILDSQMFRLKGVMPKREIKKDTETYTKKTMEFDYNSAKKGLTEFVEVPISISSTNGSVYDLLLKVTRAKRLLSDIDKRDIWEALAKITAKFENAQMIGALSAANTTHAATAAWDSGTATVSSIANDINELIPKIDEYSSAELAIIGPTNAMAKLQMSNEYGQRVALDKRVTTLISTSLITDKAAYIVPKDSTIAFTGVAEEADQHMWEENPKTMCLGFSEAVMPFVAESNAVYKLTGVLS